MGMVLAGRMGGGFGFGRVVRSGGAPAPSGEPAPAYTMLYDFEDPPPRGTASNITLAQHTGARKVLGNAGMQITSAVASGLYWALIRDDVTTDLAPFKRVMMAINLGTPAKQPLTQPLIRFRVGSTVYAHAEAATVHKWHRGKITVSIDLDRIRNGSTSIQATGTVAKRFEIFPLNVASAGLDIVTDAAVLTGDYKPSIMLTMDDNNVEQAPGTAFYTAIMEAGIKLTVYAIRDAISTPAKAGKLSEAQIRQMRADGHAICMDSQHAGAPIFAGYETVNDLIAGLADDREDLIARNLSDEASLKHLCYGNGRLGMDIESSVVPCTGNGTATIAVGGNGAFSSSTTGGIAPGMIVTGTGVPANTRVRMVTADNSALLNNVIPAGAVNLTFTADPANEWYATNLIDRLIAEGYESGRLTDLGGVCTAYGLDKRVSLAFFGRGIDFGTAAATITANIESNVLLGLDAIYYFHAPQPGELATHYQLITDKVVELVAAGKANSVTVPQGMAAAFARGWV